MKIKKVISIVIILCFFIIWTGTARADVSDINENEQRVIDAAVEGYMFDGKKYVATESGIAALQRKMRTVDLDKRDADNLIESQLSKYDIEDQLQKGYIKPVGEDSVPNSTAAPPSSAVKPQEPTPVPPVSQSPAEGSQDIKVPDSGNAGNGNSNQLNNGNSDQQNNGNSDINSNIAVTDDAFGISNAMVKNDDFPTSNVSEKRERALQASQAKASSIWNAIISDWTVRKDGGSDDEEDSDKDTLSNASKNSGTDSEVSLVEQTLNAIESENKEKTKMSSYKMRSEDDADIKIMCETDSDEVKITDKDGNTIVSFADSNATSKGIEGNIIHVEWIIPVSLILLFISIVFLYIEFKGGCYAKTGEEMSLSRKVRNSLSIMMGLLLVICILIIFVAAGLFSGLFRSSTVIQALNNSSYYEYAYAEMAKNTVRILGENNIDSLVLADVLDYDDFTLAIKQQIERQLSTLDEELSIEKTQDNVNTKIDEYYKTAEEQKLEESGIEETKDEKKARKVERKQKVSVITNSIMTNYKKYADFYPSHFIRQLKRDLRAVFQVVLPVTILTIFVNMFALYHLYRRRYKGIGYIGDSVALAALAALIATGIVFQVKPYANFYLSPEYLYQFVLSYLNRVTETFLIISVFLIILAVIILVLNRIIFPKKQRT